MWKHFFGARWVRRPSTALLPWLSNARVANLKGTPQKEPFFFEGQVFVYWCSHRKIPSVFSIASTAQIGLSLNTNLALHEIITFPQCFLGEKFREPRKKNPVYFPGRNYGLHDRQHHHHPDEDDGFDEHYFRRRPKSVCMSANTTADGRRFIPPTYGGPAPAHLPPHNLGIPTDSFQPVASAEDHHRMTMVSWDILVGFSKTVASGDNVKASWVWRKHILIRLAISFINEERQMMSAALLCVTAFLICF